MGTAHRTLPPRTLKAVTLYQPYASAIAYGLKTVETRDWPPWHLDSLNVTPLPLAIHASRRFDAMGLGLEPMRRLERAAGVKVNDLPSGCVVAVALLTEARMTRDTREGLRGWADRLPEAEREWGDFGLGRWGWFLTDVWRLKKPVPCRGTQRLWNFTLPDDEVELVNVLNPEVRDELHRAANGSLFPGW
jgi:hypothetical protein